MEVKQNGSAKNGVFYIEENNKQIATLNYVFAGKTKFIIEHTVVNPGNEGKGLGKQLVHAAVNFARDKNYKIVPLCPFANAVLKKTKEWQDVLA